MTRRISNAYQNMGGRIWGRLKLDRERIENHRELLYSIHNEVHRPVPFERWGHLKISIQLCKTISGGRYVPQSIVR
jgi:hypothetical protein